MAIASGIFATIAFALTLLATAAAKVFSDNSLRSAELAERAEEV